MLFIYIVILFLSVIGIVDIIHCFQQSLLRMKRKRFSVLLCQLYGDKADINLLYVIEQYKWLGTKYADRIVAVDLLSDQATRKRCFSLANKHNIEILKPNEINNLIFCGDINE